jgi:hypothetical protein
MGKDRASPNFLAFAGIVLVLMGALAGFVAPFVSDGREFVTTESQFPLLLPSHAIRSKVTWR